MPDSNWFTNRLGTRQISVEELLKGPDTTSGPAPGMWTVIDAKNDGVTPGFTVRDSTGTVWFLKVDPPGYRAMATGTEVVVTKLLWALGYYVPEVHLSVLDPEQLTTDVQLLIPRAIEAIRESGALESIVRERIEPFWRSEAVAELLASYDMLAVAVCDEAGRLLGAVTVDDVLDRQLGSGWRSRGPSSRTRTA